MGGVKNKFFNKKIDFKIVKQKNRDVYVNFFFHPYNFKDKEETAER